MSEQGLFERISDGVKSFLNPMHGTEDCLLFMIEENVKPRDTGTLFVACGKKMVFEVPNLALYGSDPEPVLSSCAFTQMRCALVRSPGSSSETCRLGCRAKSRKRLLACRSPQLLDRKPVGFDFVEVMGVHGGI